MSMGTKKISLVPTQLNSNFCLFFPQISPICPNFFKKNAQKSHVPTLKCLHYNTNSFSHTFLRPNCNYRLLNEIKHQLHTGLLSGCTDGQRNTYIHVCRDEGMPGDNVCTCCQVCREVKSVHVCLLVGLNVLRKL